LACSTAANNGRAGARRRILRAALVAGAWLALAGHSPYRQWDVHRRTRLVLLVSRSDERSVALGKALAALYAARLPESGATVARARDDNDLLRLLASKQLDVALLREGRYAGTDSLALRALAALGEHVMVCRQDLPDASAYMLTEALVSGWGDIDPALVAGTQGPRPDRKLAIPVHPGALKYYLDHR
jgi:hypothetical protein